MSETKTKNSKKPKEKSGYKWTKVGWIPEEWEIKELGKLGNVLSGLIYSPKDVIDNGTLVLRSSNIQENRLSFKDNVYVDTSNLKFNEVKQDDILICVRNGSKNLIGKNASISKEVEGEAFGAFMSIYRSKHNGFLRHYFKTELYQQEIHKNLGATINSINGSNLKKFKVPFPPLPEQQKISSILNTWDKAIATQEQLIAQKQALKKGLMQQLLTGKKRFAGFEGEWEEVRLEKLLKIGNGKDYKHLNNGTIPVYGTGGIITYVDDFLYEGESVGIGRKGTIDKPVYLTGKFWTVDTLFYCYSFENCKPQYIYYLFQTINWKRYNEASGVPSLSQSTIKSIKVKVPDIKEQTKIIEILSKIDSQIKSLVNKLTEIQKQKQGLMQQLLTGEKRVKV